jgi:heme/copper-type cytochrome/quinol oxidase subunit 3
VTRGMLALANDSSEPGYTDWKLFASSKLYVLFMRLMMKVLLLKAITTMRWSMMALEKENEGKKITFLSLSFSLSFSHIRSIIYTHANINTHAHTPAPAIELCMLSGGSIHCVLP